MSATPADLAGGDARYANQSQMLLIAVMTYLESPANMLVPRTQKEIIEGVSATRDQVFRTLQTAVSTGWVEETSGGYVISPDRTKVSDRVRWKLMTLHRTYLEDELNG